MSTIFRLVLKTQVTRGRAAALAALGLLAVILGIAVRVHNGSDSLTGTGMFDVIDKLGLAVIAPVTSLVLASAALGDLAEDRTMVYVWLRPVPRWQMVLGAYGATLAAALPFVLVPLVVSNLIGGGGAALLGGAVAAGAIAVCGYSALFLGLGLRVRRALVWGLGYVVVWEGAVARAARGAARISVQVYARSLLATIADHAPPRQAAGQVTSIVVPIVVVIAAYFVTVRWLEKADVA